MTLTVDDLRAAGFAAQCDSIEQAIADHREGKSANVAVVSEPFAGRDVLLSYAEELLGEDVERLRFAPPAAEGDLPKIPETPAVILDDCHYLFRRSVGGFEALDHLLEQVAVSETLFLTSWNRYAWRYLAAVRDVDDSFPVEVRIPPLSADQIAVLIEENYGGEMPTFVDTGEAGRIKTVAVERVPVGLPGGRTLTVPILSPNPEWLSSWWADDTDAGIEAVVYEKLRRVSHGNPGLVTRFWEDGIEDGEIAPADIADPVTAPSLDDETAMLALLLIQFEAVSWDVLAEMMPADRIEPALQQLETEGIVRIEDGEVSLAPAGVHATVAALERRQLLW